MDKPTVDFYNQHAKAQSDLYERADMSVMYRRLETILPQHSRILEIGCGSGRDARALSGMGFSVVATDASNGMIQEAIKRTECKCGDLSFTCLSFPIPENHSLFNERFDLVLAVAVIMHLFPKERQTTLSQISRLLRTEGLFYCSFKNQTNSDERLCQIIGANDLLNECRSVGLYDCMKEFDSDILGRNTVWTTMMFRKDCK